MDEGAGPFISARALEAWMRRPDRPVLLDIRFRSTEHDRRYSYLAGHIPGAVYVDLQVELAGTPGGVRGNRPLPEVAALQAHARRWGTRQGGAVVVYDDDRLQQAGRAWWVLRWAGIADVRLLDGGLEAWQREGLPVATDITAPCPGDVVLHGGAMPVMDADEAALVARRAVLLDTRGPVNYQGRETPPGEPTSGHIPGALHAPSPGSLDAHGLHLPADVLRERFRAMGVEPGKEVGAYCGGGVTATFQIAVLEMLGIRAKLFPGSWSAWSADPARPVARGPEPG